MSESKPTILVFVAHSDDEVLGCGGTIAKYAKKGYDVHTIICSFGESSHPHLKPEIIRKTRVQEAKRADTILGGNGVQFLGLREGNFLKDIEKGSLFKNLVKRIKELKPERILTHDPHDSHPDHQAVHKIVLRIAKKLPQKTEIYTFHIWTIFNRQRTKTPLWYVDVTDEFRQKIRALHAFPSQISMLSYTQANNFLYVLTYLKAFVAGLRKGVRYAEVFHKIER